MVVGGGEDGGGADVGGADVGGAHGADVVVMAQMVVLVVQMVVH